MSFLSRHRTICAVLDDIRILGRIHDDPKIIELVNEAKIYAERMSAKLQEYKENERK